MMNSDEALVVLVRAFGVDMVSQDDKGATVTHFGGDRPFSLKPLDEMRVVLCAPVAQVAPDSAAARRLLEANCLGAETGSGAIACDPLQGGIVLVETIDLAGFDEDRLQSRLVDFLIYAEFWATEGRKAIAKEEASLTEPHQAVIRV
jgi:hypothetical protein